MGRGARVTRAMSVAAASSPRPPPSCSSSPTIGPEVEGREDVDLGQRGAQFGGMARDQAAVGCHLRAARVGRLGGVEQDVDRLGLGGVDEAAGVDEDEVGGAGRGRPVAGTRQRRPKPVRIGLVLGTPEGDDGEARVQR